MSREKDRSSLIQASGCDPVDGLKLLIVESLMLLPNSDREELLRAYKCGIK